MNALEAIALQRAQEQLASDAWKTPEPSETKRGLRIVKAGLDPRQTCDCGTCRTCIKRESMRRFRERQRTGNPVPIPRGKRMATDRVCCFCAGPIAVTNRSDICGACHHTHAARRVDHCTSKRGYYSHGGGI